MIPLKPNSILQERIEKPKKLFHNDDDDFLSCLKYPLSDRIAYKIFNGKKKH